MTSLKAGSRQRRVLHRLSAVRGLKRRVMLYSGSPGISLAKMSGKLDPKIAERLADSAIGRLKPERAAKISCTRGTLRETILQAAQEAYAVGVLAGRREQNEQLPAPDRPGWRFH